MVCYKQVWSHTYLPHVKIQPWKRLNIFYILNQTVIKGDSFIVIEIVVCFIVQLSEVKGHSWLCESLQTLSNSSQQLRDIDTKGHFGIAAKVYARIASQCLVNKQKDTSINLSLDAVSVADSLLSEYQSNDFTRTMHAYRTGMFEIDPSMFTNIIFPAYFSSQLATPLELTKEIFLQSGVTLWGDDAQQCSAEFLSSEIFSEQFYSMLVGIFVTNCLSVHVASPLDKVWADARHLNHSKNAEESAKMQDVVSFMQHCFDLQQRDGGTEQNDEEERPVTDRFLGMSGSGLFPVFSKTNHSCVCNTSMHGSDRVTVSMYATEAIAQGAEITNCYIHHHSLNGGGGTFRSRLGVETGDDIDESIDPAELSLGRSDQHQLNAKLTKKQRYRALRQYIFECDCPLCASQEIDSGEESD